MPFKGEIQFLVYFLTIIVAVFSEQSENWSIDQLSKIFNGDKVLHNEYPYLVNIRRNDAFKCGGTLITTKCVLTAAHCLENQKNVQNLRVYGVQTCLADKPEVRKVLHAILPQNPSYDDEKSLDMDIVVLRLCNSFTRSGMKPIAMDYRKLKVGVNLTISGWGDTGDQTQDASNRCLMATNVSSIARVECHNTTGKYHPITENMFCALGTDKRDACPGDSGGPIVRNGRQVGIVSWGIGCGSGYPGVYTSLSSRAVSNFLYKTIRKYC